MLCCSNWWFFFLSSCRARSKLWRSSKHLWFSEEIAQLAEGIFFLFSCIAGQVRDMVGQQLEFVWDWNQISPEERNPQGTKPNKDKQNPHTSQGTRPGKPTREICKLSETRWNIRAPLSPSNVLVHRVVLLHVVQWLDVSHINICTWVLRRVSYVWLQTSSLELIRALSSLPPFCTILHECINFRLCYCFLVW